MVWAKKRNIFLMPKHSVIALWYSNIRINWVLFLMNTFSIIIRGVVSYTFKQCALMVTTSIYVYGRLRVHKNIFILTDFLYNK